MERPAPVFDKQFAHFQVTFSGCIEEGSLRLEIIDDIGFSSELNHFRHTFKFIVPRGVEQRSLSVYVLFVDVKSLGNQEFQASVFAISANIKEN